jgi:hypothetical protein
MGCKSSGTTKSTQQIAALLVCGLVASTWSGSCTRPNPDFCCLTEADCTTLGVGELRTCASDQVCDGNVCHGIQCATSAECNDAAAPYCVAQLCKAACTGDQDCVGSVGPLCASDGVCVGCERNADCPSTSPVCDPSSRACAPCRADADCPSGVCLAADSVCAVATELIYISNAGVGQSACTLEDPCRSFAQALDRVGPGRRIVRILGSEFTAIGGVSLGSKEVYVDGQNTLIRRDSEGEVVAITGTSPVTLEGLKFGAPAFPGGRHTSLYV